MELPIPVPERAKRPDPQIDPAIAAWHDRMATDEAKRAKVCPGTGSGSTSTSTSTTSGSSSSGGGAGGSSGTSGGTGGQDCGTYSDLPCSMCGISGAQADCECRCFDFCPAVVVGGCTTTSGGSSSSSSTSG